jgi:hypothetical protein
MSGIILNVVASTHSIGKSAGQQSVISLLFELQLHDITGIELN